jgi:hypothetical protein
MTTLAKTVFGSADLTDAPPAARSQFLRRVLLLDAAASGAMGLLLTLGAGPLTSLLGLPGPLLRGAGLVLIPFALGLILLARRPALSRAAVWAVIGLNAMWVVDSLILLAAGGLQPTALGTAFVLAQAAAVAGLAVLEYLGLKRLG